MHNWRGFAEEKEYTRIAWTITKHFDFILGQLYVVCIQCRVALLFFPLDGRRGMAIGRALERTADLIFFWVIFDV